MDQHGEKRLLDSVKTIELAQTMVEASEIADRSPEMAELRDDIKAVFRGLPARGIPCGASRGT